MSLFIPLNLEMIHKKTKVYLFLHLFTKCQSYAQRESYDDFPQVACLRCNSGAYKNPTFLGSYLQNYSDTRFEMCTRGSSRFWLKWALISSFETS